MISIEGYIYIYLIQKRIDWGGEDSNNKCKTNEDRNQTKGNGYGYRIRKEGRKEKGIKQEK